MLAANLNKTVAQALIKSTDRNRKHKTVKLYLNKPK